MDFCDIGVSCLHPAGLSLYNETNQSKVGLIYCIPQFHPEELPTHSNVNVECLTGTSKYFQNEQRNLCCRNTLLNVESANRALDVTVLMCTCWLGVQLMLKS